LQRIVAIFVVVVCGLAGNAAAGKRPIGFMLGGGASGTIGDLSTHSSFGFHGSAGLRFTPTPSPRSDIDLLLVGSLHSFPNDDSNTRKISMMMFGFLGRINNVLNSNANIYATSGAGLARTKLGAYEETIRFGASVMEIVNVQERTETNPYVSGGIGLQFGKPEKVQFFVETQITNVFGTEIKNLTWFPVTIGILY
jgi:hypothetical protein